MELRPVMRSHIHGVLPKDQRKIHHSMIDSTYAHSVSEHAASGGSLSGEQVFDSEFIEQNSSLFFSTKSVLAVVRIYSPRLFNNLYIHSYNVKYP